MLGKLVQTAEVYAKTARGSAPALKGPLESRDSAAYGHSTVRAPRQANEMDILPLPGLRTSGTLSALNKGIQPLGQLRKDSDAGDCVRECTVIENGEGAVGRRVEVDMLLWVPGSHGGLRVLQVLGTQSNDLAPMSEASGWWLGTTCHGLPRLVPR